MRSITPRTGPSGTNVRRRIEPAPVLTVRLPGVRIAPCSLLAVRVRSVARPSGVRTSGWGKPARRCGVKKLGPGLLSWVDAPVPRRLRILTLLREGLEAWRTLGAERVAGDASGDRAARREPSGTGLSAGAHATGAGRPVRHARQRPVAAPADPLPIAVPADPLQA